VDSSGRIRVVGAIQDNCYINQSLARSMGSSFGTTCFSRKKDSNTACPEFRTSILVAQYPWFEGILECGVWELLGLLELTISLTWFPKTILRKLEPCLAPWWSRGLLLFKTWLPFLFCVTFTCHSPHSSPSS